MSVIDSVLICDLAKYESAIIAGQITAIFSNDQLTSLTVDDHTSCVECICAEKAGKFRLGLHIRLLGNVFQKQTQRQTLTKMRIKRFALITPEDAAVHVLDVQKQQVLRATPKVKPKTPLCMNETKRQPDLNSYILEYIVRKTRIVYYFTEILYCLPQGITPEINEEQARALNTAFSSDGIGQDIREYMYENNQSQLMIQASVLDTLNIWCVTKIIVRLADNSFRIQLTEVLLFLYLFLRKFAKKSKSPKIKDLTAEMNKLYEGYNLPISLFSDQLFSYIIKVLMEKHIFYEIGHGQVSMYNHFMNLDERFHAFLKSVL